MTFRGGKYIGKPVGDPPEDEAEHFIRCPKCNGWIDMRDLSQQIGVQPVLVDMQQAVGSAIVNDELGLGLFGELV